VQDRLLGEGRLSGHGHCVFNGSALVLGYRNAHVCEQPLPGSAGKVSAWTERAVGGNAGAATQAGRKCSRGQAALFARGFGISDTKTPN